MLFRTGKIRETRWSRGLRLGSAAAPLLGCGFESRRELVNIVAPADTSAKVRSFVQGSSTESFECDVVQQ